MESALISGRLEFIRPPALFDYLRRNHQTGTLQILKGDVQRNCYFLDGEFIWVASQAPTERLGHVLTQSGLLTESRVQYAIDDSRRQGLPLTVYLLSRNLVDEMQLLEASQDLAQLVISQAFREHVGGFRLLESIPEDVTCGPIRLPDDPHPLDLHRFQFPMNPLHTSPMPDQIRQVVLDRHGVEVITFRIFPDNVLRILGKLQRPDVSIWDVTQGILDSPELGTRLLQIINSHATSQLAVDSIPDAVQLLGISRVVEIVLCLSMDSVRKHSFFREYRRHLHHESVLTAFLAKEMAVMIREDPDVLFMLGLLSHLGVLVGLGLIEKRLPIDEITRLEDDGALMSWLVQGRAEICNMWLQDIRLPSFILKPISDLWTPSGGNTKLHRRRQIIWAAGSIATSLIHYPLQRVQDEIESNHHLSSFDFSRREFSYLQQSLAHIDDLVRSILNR